MKSNNCSWNDTSVEIECVVALQSKISQMGAELKNLKMAESNYTQDMQSMNATFTKQLEKEKADWNITCNDQKKSLKEDKIHIQYQNQNLTHIIKELEIEIGKKNNTIVSLNNNIKFTNFTHQQSISNFTRAIASKDSKIDQLNTTIENLQGIKFVSVQCAKDHVFVTHHVLKVN